MRPPCRVRQIGGIGVGSIEDRSIYHDAFLFVFQQDVAGKVLQSGPQLLALVE